MAEAMADWIDLFNGKDLDGWRGRTGRGQDAGHAGHAGHAWRVAGDVRLHPDDDKLFEIEPGTSLMLNGDSGRTVDLLTTLEHGSCELHIEFCVPAKSNSGVYLQGQYEI